MHPRLWLLLLLLTISRLGWSQPMPATAGTGLQGAYYNGRNFGNLAFTRLDPTIDFNWTLERNRAGQVTGHFVPPGEGLAGEEFSVRWTGHLYAPVSGQYTFQVSTDDGMRVWVGGKRIISSWRNQPVTTVTTQLQLEGGRYYPLRVEYYQAGFDTRALLAWQLPNSSIEPDAIPARYLYSALPTSARPVPVAATPPPAPPTRPQSAGLPPGVTSTPVKSALVIGRRPTSAVVPRPTQPAPRPRPTPAPTPQPRPAPPDTVLPDLASLSRGAAITLPSLYFTQSTAALLPTSRPTLNALARRLHEQPSLRLEIAGHTDNIGDAQMNLRLSEQRARVVRQYLVQQGIDSVRLAARGYGGTRPIADNRDPQQRPRNRRVEVVQQ